MSSLSTQFLSWTPFLMWFFIQVISPNKLDFRQTIPADGIVCPGEKLQYMCTSSKGQLSWTVGNSQPVTIGGTMVVNSSKNIDDFSLLLSAKNATNISSTATNDMVTSTYDGQQIACYSGTEINSTNIDIAGPANCSSMSLMPYCHATTNSMGDTDFSITLSNASNLVCVEGYQIQFNGESENVSLNSPSANFTISDGEGPSVENEIVVHTLDYENRTGLVPCTFSIPVPDKIEEVLEPECIMRPSQDVDITFHWVPPVGGGCFKGDDVPYLYIVEFDDGQFSIDETTNTSYTVPNIMQETVVEIIISPSLPFLGLTGPPLSITVNLASMDCVTSPPSMDSFISIFSSPSATPVGGNNAVIIIVGILVPVLSYAVLMVISMTIIMIIYKYHRNKKGTKL